MQKGNGHGNDGEDYRAVLVVWRDSHSLRGWRTVDEGDHRMEPVVTIGFVHREDDSAVTLSTSLGGFGAALDPVTIPRENICVMRRIKLPAHSTKKWRTTSPGV